MHLGYGYSNFATMAERRLVITAVFNIKSLENALTLTLVRGIPVESQDWRPLSGRWLNNLKYNETYLT